MESNVPNLRRKVVLPGAGHWTQPERPAEVDRLMIEFLKTLLSLSRRAPPHLGLRPADQQLRL
jgi:hypothetical protein